jgi:ATP/maltotriose-dependent transcriptional regulator MalT
MNPMIVIQSQLLATKFYVPTSPGVLIWRPRLSALLDESLKYPLTMLWSVTPQPLLHHWLDMAEAMLTTLLKGLTPADNSQPPLAPEVLQELKNLLGRVLTNRAFLWCYTEEGHAALALCEQALALLSAEDAITRVHVAITQLIASYASLANDMAAALKCGYQVLLLAQVVGEPAYTSSMMSIPAIYMIGAGRLHEVKQLTQQAIQFGTSPTGSKLPDAGFPAVLQAEILREWNELDAARSLATEGISLYEQANSLVALIRTFVEEGAPMADLLSKLREEQRHTGPIPYLDTLLATFAQESKRPQMLIKEEEVQELTISIGPVKRHASNFPSHSYITFDIRDV